VSRGETRALVVLVPLQLFFDDEGRLCYDDMPGGVAAGKSSVHTQLEWIIASRPQVNPSQTDFEECQRLFTFATLAPGRQDGVE
jgi:hypothetical protein